MLFRVSYNVIVSYWNVWNVLYTLWCSVQNKFCCTWDKTLCCHVGKLLRELHMYKYTLQFTN